MHLNVAIKASFASINRDPHFKTEPVAARFTFKCLSKKGGEGKKPSRLAPLCRRHLWDFLLIRCSSPAETDEVIEAMLKRHVHADARIRFWETRMGENVFSSLGTSPWRRVANPITLRHSSPIHLALGAFLNRRLAASLQDLLAASVLGLPNASRAQSGDPRPGPCPPRQLPTGTAR